MQCASHGIARLFAFETIIICLCDKQCLISDLRITRELCLVIIEANFRQIKGISKLLNLNLSRSFTFENLL